MTAAAGSSGPGSSATMSPVIPPTHTGEPWAGFLHWVLAAVVGLAGLGLVAGRRYGFRSDHRNERWVMRGPRGSRQAHPRLARGVGLFLLGLALAAVVYPLWWAHRSAVGRRALLQHGANTETTASRLGSGQSRCPAGPRDGPPRVTPGRAGLLQIPAIGLRAPVLDGLSNAVLAVAVGHDPATVWPGAGGESILLAHDVSYFSALSQVHPGAPVIWTWGCERATFRVISAVVAEPEVRIAVPAAGSGLALVTCWPTNALFWTP